MTPEPAADAPAQLTLRRTSPRDARHRQIEASLDGQPFATLLFGQTATRPIPPGHHRLRVHNTLVWKTIEFDVAAGQEIVYTVINRTGWATWWMLSLLGAGPLYLSVVEEREVTGGEEMGGDGR